MTLWLAKKTQVASKVAAETSVVASKVAVETSHVRAGRLRGARACNRPSAHVPGQRALCGRHAAEGATSGRSCSPPTTARRPRRRQVASRVAEEAKVLGAKAGVKASEAAVVAGEYAKEAAAIAGEKAKVLGAEAKQAANKAAEKIGNKLAGLFK